MDDKPEETITINCIDCLTPFQVEKRLRKESSACEDCVRKYREKHGTKSRVRRRKP